MANDCWQANGALGNCDPRLYQLAVESRWQNLGPIIDYACANHLGLIVSYAENHPRIVVEPVEEPQPAEIECASR